MKKGFKIFGIILLCLLMIGVGVGGCYYFFSFNTNTKEETKETKSSSKEESKENKNITKNLDTTEPIVVNNLSKFMSATDEYCGTQKIYFAQNKVTSLDISNSLAFRTVYINHQASQMSIEKSQIDSEIASYFGKDYKYTDDTYGVCIGHKYNKETQKYEYNPATGCGGSCGASIKYLITKAELNGSIMSIYVKAIFPGTNGGENVPYYKDINLTQKIEDYDLYFNPDEVAKFKDAAKYKVILEKYDDNNYSFVSSEPVE